MKKASTRRKAGENNNVNFRLEEDELLELIQRADRLGLSRHQLGREYVVQMLAVEHERSDLVEVLKEMLTATTELRKDVAIGIEALLLASGQYTEEEASQWIQSQFKLPGE